MTILVYTETAQMFAAHQDGGLVALGAVVEREIEGLRERGLEKISDLGMHMFSWHGNNNMIMSPLTSEEAPAALEMMLVDLVDEDGQEPIHIRGGNPPSESEPVPSPFTEV